MALTDDLPGVTRDRREGDGRIADIHFRLIDTAGLEEAAPDTLAGRMRAQTERSLDNADVALLVIDAREGVTEADRHFARWLRRAGKPVILVANKAESRAALNDLAEAYELGLDDPVAISAQHGEGMGDFYERLLPFVPPPEDEAEASEEAAAKAAATGDRRAAECREVDIGQPPAPRGPGPDRPGAGHHPRCDRDGMVVAGPGDPPDRHRRDASARAYRGTPRTAVGRRYAAGGAVCRAPSSWSSMSCRRSNART